MSKNVILNIKKCGDSRFPMIQGGERTNGNRRGN